MSEKNQLKNQLRKLGPGSGLLIFRQAGLGVIHLKPDLGLGFYFRSRALQGHSSALPNPGHDQPCRSTYIHMSRLYMYMSRLRVFMGQVMNTWLTKSRSKLGWIWLCVYNCSVGRALFGLLVKWVRPRPCVHKRPTWQEYWGPIIKQARLGQALALLNPDLRTSLEMK